MPGRSQRLTPWRGAVAVCAAGQDTSTPLSRTKVSGWPAQTHSSNAPRAWSA
jgi:hypothetical protein